MNWWQWALLAWAGFITLTLLALRWCTGSDITQPPPRSPTRVPPPDREPEDILPIHDRRAA